MRRPWMLQLIDLGVLEPPRGQRTMRLSHRFQSHATDVSRSLRGAGYSPNDLDVLGEALRTWHVQSGESWVLASQLLPYLQGANQDTALRSRVCTLDVWAA